MSRQHPETAARNDELRNALEPHHRDLFAIPGVVGFGVGVSEDFVRRHPEGPNRGGPEDVRPEDLVIVVLFDTAPNAQRASARLRRMLAKLPFETKILGGPFIAASQGPPGPGD